MNKYQESLNELKDFVHSELDGTRMLDKYLGYVNTLQEAIDKANKYDDKETTFVIVDQFGIVKCGNCKE